MRNGGGRGQLGTHDALQQLEGAVEGWVVALVLHPAAGVRYGGAIAGEDLADLRQAQPARHVRQVHADLTGEGDAGATACSRPQLRARDHEHAQDRLLQHAPYELVRNARSDLFVHSPRLCELSIARIASDHLISPFKDIKRPILNKRRTILDGRNMNPVRQTIILDR